MELPTKDSLPTFSDFALNFGSLVEYTELELERLIRNDSYLNDLPFDVSSEEVLSQIAIAKGQSITVYIKRGDLPRFKVVVPHSTTTVLHLKKAIRRHFEREQLRRKVDDRPSSMAIAPTHHHHHHEHSNNREQTTLTGQPPASNRCRHQSSSDQSRDRDRDRKTATATKHRTPRVDSESSNNQPRYGESPPHLRISWRYIWRTYHLDLDGVRLADDAKRIKDYGVGNKTVLRFVKKTKSENV